MRESLPKPRHRRLRKSGFLTQSGAKRLRSAHRENSVPASGRRLAMRCLLPPGYNSKKGDRGDRSPFYKERLRAAEGIPATGDVRRRGGWTAAADDGTSGACGKHSADKAPVCGENLPREERGLLGGQEGHRVGNVLRRAQTP